MPEVQHNTLPELVEAYWPVLAVAFTVSLLSTPLCRRFALARNIVDRPDDWLKPHKKPIPYLGGVAIYLGWAAGLTVAMVSFKGSQQSDSTFADVPTINMAKVAGVLLAGTLITLLGLVDDLRAISPKLKLAGSMLIALLLIGFGIGDDLLRVFSTAARVRFEAGETWVIYAYSLPVSVFIIVGACNATNLIDGLDGLCSGVLGIISTGFLLLAVFMHLHSRWAPEEAQRVVVSLSLLGAALGFLPFNRNPARIFMGDAGSMLLGLNAAILLLMFADERSLNWMMGALMVFGLPVADMVLTLARRWRAQRPLMIGDRSHFYDQLIDRGFSVRAVVRISYVTTGCFVIVGLLPIVLRTRYLFIAYGAFTALVMYVIHRFKMVRVDGPPAADRPAQ